MPRANYKPLNPTTRCFHCDRLIATTRGKFRIHYNEQESGKRASLVVCKGSLQPFKKERSSS